MVSYYRVILRYGHVGLKRDVAVARFLEITGSHRLIDVYDIASSMPGVKSHGVAKVERINREAYVRGVSAERTNFYLQALMSRKTG